MQFPVLIEFFRGFAFWRNFSTIFRILIGLISSLINNTVISAHSTVMSFDSYGAPFVSKLIFCCRLSYMWIYCIKGLIPLFSVLFYSLFLVKIDLLLVLLIFNHLYA